MPNRSLGEDGSTFEQLLEFAPDAIVGVDAHGRIVLANTQAATLFGHPRDGLIGAPIELLVPEHHRPRHPTHRDQYFRDPQVRPMGAGLDLSARRRDGTTFPAEIQLSSLETGDGRIALVAIRDVTERRDAVQARARLAAIVDSSSDAIIGHTADGTITSWNPAAARLYGYTAQEAVGRSIAMLQWGDVAQTLGPPALTETAQHDATHLRSDGTSVEVVQRTSHVTGPRGEDLGMATIVKDVTDERRAQRTFQGLLEFAPDAIVGVLQDGRISLANRQAEALFGYRRGELVGIPIERLVPRRRAAGHAAHRHGYFADPATRPMGAGRELAGRRKDGSEFPAEISLSSLETSDGPIAVAAVRDLSERAASERERVLQEELDQARRLESVGQLAGGIAHDFNNLLGVILTLTDLVAQELPDGSPQRADLDEIGAAATRAAALTRQLLIFSRREQVTPEVLDLAELIAGIDRLLQRALGERIQLAVELQPPLWPVHADRGQLEQVLVNLAVNARDAMPDGGQLAIRMRNAVVDPARTPGPDSKADPLPNAAGRYVRIEVTDEGVGMAPDVVERAFEPFYTTKPKGRGTGLGLATVYGIITRAGGHIALSSAVDRGTSVIMHLPATDLPGGPHSDAEDDPNGGRGECVLIVEDETSVRRVAARILRGAGYDVMEAASGAEALRLSEQHDWALVLSDVIMPGMVGPDLVSLLRQDRPELRVVFMSGYSHKVLEGEELGTAPRTSFIEKPFTAAQLRRVVRRALDQAHT